MSIHLKLLFAVTILTLIPRPVAAQNEVSRRDYGTPGLTINTGGRTGACDVLLFTNDGKHLLAVGDDKVVRNWSVTADGLVPSDLPDLRWSCWQEKRGLIHALALSPNNKLAAIGGDGMNSGTVAVLDRHSGAVVRGVLGNKKFNVRKIWSMAFHPDGQTIAYGTDDGWVCLWKLGEPLLIRFGQHATPKGKGFNRVLLVTYLSPQKLLSVAESGEGHIWEMNAKLPTAPEVFHFKNSSLHRVALSPDGKWLAGIEAGGNKVTSIELLNLANKTSDVINEQEFMAPNCLAFDKSSKRLAVGYFKVDSDADFQRETDFEVLLYDVAARKKLSTNPVAVPTYIPECVAFHPNGKWLAVAGGTDHQVTLWNIDARKPLAEFAQGKGKCLWGVGLTDDNRYLAFQDERNPRVPGINQRGTGAWKLFDLQELRWAKPKELKFYTPPANPTAADAGWQVLTARADFTKRSDRWWIKGPGLAEPVALPWDPSDGLPRCYAVLPPIKSHPNARLVVGHAWGASVFDLVPSKGAVRTRLLSGHEGEVFALAVSNDQKRLVTASRDQTIAGWPLDDWPTHPTFGARVTLIDNELVVEDVDVGSPAWEMGLSRKDTIVFLAVNLTDVKYHRQVKGNAKEALKILANPTPGQQLYVKWQPEGKNVILEQLTSTRQRPLFRFFAAGTEWVLWRWRDHEYACSTRGDSLIGWQLNHWKKMDQGTDKARDEMLTPDFFGAEQMRQVYFKPDVIAAMLKTWTTRPEPVKLAEIAPPEVRIELASTVKVQDGKVIVKDADLTLVLYANSVKDAPIPLAGKVTNQTLTKAILWINDYKAAEWDPGNNPFPKNVVIARDKLRRGYNEILLQCYNHGAARGQSRPLIVFYDGPPEPQTLHGLFVGVGNYSRANPPQEELRANKDAMNLVEVWQEQKGKLYKDVKIHSLVDQGVTAAAVKKALDDIAKDRLIRPDDLFVFYLGGHGTRPTDLASTFKMKKKDLDGLSPYLFCCGNFDIKRPRETTINFSELYEALVKIPCRKLLLLDTCHAGGINKNGVPSNPIRELTPDGVGPVILLACQPHQSALGHAQVDRWFRFTGLFLVALAMTLDEEFDSADRNKDNVLFPEEVADSLLRLMPQLVNLWRKAAAKGSEEDQTPESFIPHLERLFPVVGR